MRSALVVTAAAAAVATSAACVRRPAAASADGVAAAADSVAAAVWLTVESHNRASVVLYLVRGNLRQRLGTVTAAATQRFQIPPNVARDPSGFFIAAEPIGGDPPGRTEVLRVTGGQRIVWTLESNLGRSSVAVY